MVFEMLFQSKVHLSVSQNEHKYYCVGFKFMPVISFGSCLSWSSEVFRSPCQTSFPDSTEWYLSFSNFTISSAAIGSFTFRNAFILTHYSQILIERAGVQLPCGRGRLSGIVIAFGFPLHPMEPRIQ